MNQRIQKSMEKKYDQIRFLFNESVIVDQYGTTGSVSIKSPLGMIATGQIKDLQSQFRGCYLDQEEGAIVVYN